MDINKEKVDYFLAELISFVGAKANEEISYRNCHDTWMGGNVGEDDLKKSLYKLFDIE